MSENTVTRDNLSRWELLHEGRAWGRYPPEELVRFVGRNYFGVLDRPSIRFLELGCGQGANLWFLLHEGYRVAGIDGSGAAVRKCEQRLRAEGLWTELSQCDLRVGDFSQLPWPDECFDVVIDVESISANTMDTIRAAVGSAFRVLKPGGKMFCKMFGVSSKGAGTGVQIEGGTTLDPAIGPLAGIGIIHFFTESEIRALFAAFASIAVDWSTRGSGTCTEIHEWIVQARK